MKKKWLSTICATTLVVTSILTNPFVVQKVKASSPQFSQNEGYDPALVDAFNGGYQEGAYDKNAIWPMPLGKNSTIQSRFSGVQDPYDKKDISRWKLNVEEALKQTVYWSTDAAIGSDGTIYKAYITNIATNDAKLVAINPDGSIKWISGTNLKDPRGSIVLDSTGKIIVASGDLQIKNLYVFRPDGTLETTYLMPGGIIESPVIGADGTLYYFSDEYNSDKYYLVAQKGSSKTFQVYFYARPVGSPVIGKDGTVYMVTSGGAGSASAIMAFNPDGTLKWNYVADPDDKTNSFSELSIGPDGTLYFVYRGQLYAVKNKTTLWTRGSGISGMPYVGKDGIIYVNTSSQLEAYDSSGQLLWSNSALKNLRMVGADGTYYTGEYNEAAYDQNKSLKWKLTNISGTPLLSADGTIIYDGNRVIHAVGHIQLPPNQVKYNDHFMTVLSDSGTSATINYLNPLPSDAGGNPLVWQISEDGINFSNTTISNVVDDGKIAAKLNSLDPTKGYYIRTIYKNTTGREMVYQRMILRPEKYTGRPLPGPSDFQPPYGQPPYELPAPSIRISQNVISESPSNDGSISATQIVTLENGTFVADMNSGVTVNNLPAGLGINVTRNSDTQITIAFTGKAIAHSNADDVTNASITIDQAKINGATGPVTSDTFMFDFQDNTPAAVTNFRQTAVTPTTVTLAWDAVPGADQYEIKNDSGIVVYNGAGVTTQISGLTPKTSETFTIVAKNIYGSSPAATVTVTLPEIGTPTVDQPISTKNSITFQFSEVEGATKYVVSRNPEWTYQSAGGNRYDVTWRNTATGEGPNDLGPVYAVNGKITHTETSLAANTPYTYSITAYDANGNASGSTQVTATTEPLSNVADLQSLSLSVGSLAPAFSSGTSNYTAAVANENTSITITAVPQDANATVTINGNTTVNNRATVSLNVGDNPITITVTAEDGSSRTYIVTVTREKATFGTFSVQATNVTTTGAKLLWNDLGAGVTYQVSLSPNDGAGSMNGNTYTLSNLKPATSYTATVTATKEGFVPKQATTTFTTQAEDVVSVSKPTIKLVRMLDASTIKFVVESKDGDAVKVNDVIKQKEGTNTDYELVVPAGIGTQTYTVVAMKNGHESQPVTVTINVSDLATKVVDPSTITIQSYSSGAKFSWGAVADVTRYRVEYSKAGSNNPVSLVVSSPEAYAKLPYGDYEVTVYAEYQGVWGPGANKTVTYAPPAPEEQNPTDFTAEDGQFPGSKVLNWKGTTKLVTVEVKQNGQVKQSTTTRFQTATFYNLENGDYEAYIDGKLVGTFSVTTASNGSDNGGGTGKTNQPANLEVTDGEIPGSKILKWTGTTGIVKVELKQAGEVKDSKETRYTTASFYNLANGTYDVFVASIHLGSFTVDNVPDQPDTGTPVSQPKNLQVTDGPMKGSKEVRWEGTSGVVTVELKIGNDLKASTQTRFLNATFYNLAVGTYDVYVAGIKLGSFEVTGDSSTDPGTGTQPNSPINLHVENGYAENSKVVSWEGTSGMVTVELKQGEVVKAQKSTRFTTVTFTDLAPGTYDVYVAGTKLGSLSVANPNENDPTPQQPVYEPVLIPSSNVNYKTLSWKGTTGVVKVEIKDGEQVVKSFETRFLTQSIYQLPDKIYEVYIAGNFAGYVSIHTKFTASNGQTVLLQKGQFIYEEDQQPYTGEITTLTPAE